MAKYYKIIFDGLSGGGDYDGYDFGVAEDNGDTNLWVTVQMSRDAVREWTKNLLVDQLPGVAAKAVEQYLLGMVPGSVITAKSESTVRLALKTTTWYPGQPGRPEIIANWNEFDVEIPKPPLGFKTPPPTT